MKKTAITGMAALVLLSGCAENSAVQPNEIKETSEAEEIETQTDYAGKTVTGQVTAVSGNMAEIETGRMVYDKETLSGETETEMPGQSEHGSKPDGQPLEKPAGKQGGDFPHSRPGGIFVPTGDTITIETDEELLPGDYVKIVFASDGSVESICPADMHAAGRKEKSSEESRGTSANTISETGYSITLADGPVLR